MKESTPHTQRIDEKTFSVVRKGFDPREVKTFLEDLENAFQDIEGHARRMSQRVLELERDLAAARATEKASLDNAMLAVFDVKDRMIDRAERRAREIEDEASRTASSMLAEVNAARGREPELERRISNLEHELVRSRADGERLRVQLNDAHTLIDNLETSTTVDITTLQAELQNQEQQNSELRATVREFEYLRREYEDKLAEAEQARMHARAQLEAMQAEHTHAVATAADEDSRTVVYERKSDVEDFEALLAAADEERISQAI